MSSHGDEAFVARLLASVDDYERATSEPGDRLLVRVDGRRLEEIDLGDGPVILQLPELARSVCLEDEQGTVRAYLGLDELDAEERSCDQGRILLSLEHQPGGRGLRIEPRELAGRPRRVSLVHLVSPDEPAAGDGAPPQARLGEWGADDGVAVSRIRSRSLAAPRRRSRLGAVALVVAAAGCAAGALFWHAQYRDSQVRLEAERAERQRLEDERAHVEQERRDTEERISKLTAELERATSEVERAKLQAELDAERRKAAAAPGRVGAGATSARSTRPACKPGDPLCADM